MEVVRHQIVIAADAAELSELRDQVFQICGSEAIPMHATRLMVLAIDEAVSNVIEHAHLTEGKKDIELCLEIDQERIVAEIIDRGRPFDPSPACAEPDTRIYPRRGFGLYLIHKIVDGIDYERTGDGLNVLRLTKHLG